MKLSFSLVLMVVIFVSQGALAAKKRAPKVRYPVAKLVVGKVFLIDDAITIENREAKLQEREKTVRSGSVLKDKAHLRTESKSEIDLALADGSRLVVMENSQVEIPGIAWENGEILEIRLIHGQIRYQCEKDCHRKIISPIYEDILQDGNFVLTYDQAAPSIELMVLEGKTSFRGLENESSVQLDEGQKAKFAGVMENGEPAFDILLKGRKVARGQMGEIQTMSDSEKNSWKKREAVIKKEAAKVAKAQVAKKKSSQICVNPLGELNQCAWQCQKNPKGAKDCAVSSGAVCVRTRCNANGEWADRIELPAAGNKCGLKAIVDQCDY